MRATGRSSAHFKTRSTSNPALSVQSVLEDVPRPPPNMSDDAAQAQREADAPAVGTVRKAEDAPGGDAERAAPRAKVSAEDLARALGGAAATAAVKTDTSAAPVGPNFGVEEVRDPDLCLSFPFLKLARDGVDPTRRPLLVVRARPSLYTPERYLIHAMVLLTNTTRTHVARATAWRCAG